MSSQRNYITRTLENKLVAFQETPTLILVYLWLQLFENNLLIKNIFLNASSQRAGTSCPAMTTPLTGNTNLIERTLKMKRSCRQNSLLFRQRKRCKVDLILFNPSTTIQNDAQQREFRNHSLPMHWHELKETKETPYFLISETIRHITPSDIVWWWTPY